MRVHERMSVANLPDFSIFMYAGIVGSGRGAHTAIVAGTFEDIVNCFILCNVAAATRYAKGEPRIIYELFMHSSCTYPK